MECGARDAVPLEQLGEQPVIRPEQLEGEDADRDVAAHAHTRVRVLACGAHSAAEHPARFDPPNRLVPVFIGWRQATVIVEPLHEFCDREALVGARVHIDQRLARIRPKQRGQRVLPVRARALGVRRHL